MPILERFLSFLCQEEGGGGSDAIESTPRAEAGEEGLKATERSKGTTEPGWGEARPRGFSSARSGLVASREAFLGKY